MTDVEKAVFAAQAALPKYLGGRQPDSVRVEEVLPPDHREQAWRITVSYLEPGVEVPTTLIPHPFRPPPPPERVMKVITVDASTFEPRSMTLRQAG